VGYNTHVHGSNTVNLSVQLSLSLTSKNAISFLLSLMFSHQKNWKTRGQNSLGLEGEGLGMVGAGQGAWGRGGPSNVYTYE
jgi:hypothetical protein